MQIFIDSFLTNAISIVSLLLAFAIYRGATKNSRELKIASEAVFKRNVEHLMEDFGLLREDFKNETSENSGGFREAINQILAVQLTQGKELKEVTAIVHRLEGTCIVTRRLVSEKK